MTFLPTWRIQCLAVLVVAGCGAHPPANPPPSDPGNEVAQADRPPARTEPEGCISKAVQDKIHCVGVERRPRRRPALQAAGTAGRRPFERRDPVEKIELAPEQALVQPAPVTSGGTRARTEATVRASVATLERQLQAAASPPARPRLLRALADAQVELEALALRRQLTAESEAFDHRRRKHPRRAAAARARASQADRDGRGARDQAIAYYTQLLRQHPTWCATPAAAPPDRGCADEVLHHLSYEHETNGNRGTALGLSRELIARFPRSKYLPNALLAVGEGAFADAARDPVKWQDARRAYERVIAVAPPRHSLVGYARYKLAYVFWNLSDFAKAIAQLAKVIELGQAKGAPDTARRLAKSARRDLIPLYALGGNLTQAHSFFQPLSGAPGQRRDGTLTMLRALGKNLTEIGRYREAVRLYRDVLQRDPGRWSCDDQAAVTVAVLASETHKPDVAAQLRLQLSTYAAFGKAKHPAEAKRRCARSTGAQLLETAMSWHVETVGSGGVRGTRSREDMKLAAELYRLVIDHFPAEQIATFGRRTAAEPSPSLATVRYAHADLLYFMGEWGSCGPAFDQVADDPTYPNAAEAAFAAVLCYANAEARDRRATSTTRSSSARAGNDLNPQQQRLLAAYERYACGLEPPPPGSAEVEQLVEVLYARAQANFDAGRVEEAAAGFRQVAIDHPTADAASAAAVRYVESLNLLATKVGRPRTRCADDLQRDLPTLLELHCSAAKLTDNGNECAALQRLGDDQR